MRRAGTPISTMAALGLKKESSTGEPTIKMAVPMTMMSSAPRLPTLRASLMRLGLPAP